MKISVIIPTFNRAEVLPRSIDSVLNQTFSPLELIVVDDGSTDGTSAVLSVYEKRGLLKVIRTKNRGVSAARNTAIKESNGEWIALLDSDDEWLPEKLEKQVEFTLREENVPLVHAEEIWIRNGKRVNPKNIHQKSGGHIFEKCLPLCLISPSASLIKKEVLEAVGYFDEEFEVCEDYDLWLRLTSLYPVGFIKDPLIKKYGGHEDQLSRKYKAMDYWRVKSLDRILKIRELENKIKRSVLEEIIRKGEILMNGYRKHDNMENYSEVSLWVNSASKTLESLFPSPSSSSFK